MSFLLDTDTCSVSLKQPSNLIHRMLQHTGRLYISTVTLAELYVFAFQRVNPQPLIQSIENDLLTDLQVLDFDSNCAKTFGQLRGQMLQRGVSPSRMDLLIAATAIAHQLIVVTHNTADFANIPGVMLDDWMKP